MKNETSSAPIKGYIELDSPINTFITEGNHESKKLKDINTNFTDDELKYEHYKKCFVQ